MEYLELFSSQTPAEISKLIDALVVWGIVIFIGASLYHPKLVTSPAGFIFTKSKPAFVLLGKAIILLLKAVKYILYTALSIAVVVGIIAAFIANPIVSLLVLIVIILLYGAS